MIDKLCNFVSRKTNVVGYVPFTLEGARYGKHGIPYCPTTVSEIPSSIITYSEAKEIWNKEIRNNPEFTHTAFVCFYEDDYKFEAPTTGIMADPESAFEILRHFAGIITPDFSTNQDFPEPLKILNTSRMREFGYWFGTICGRPVVNNVRWGTRESYWYCFEGIPKKSIIAISTVGGSPRKLENRERFEEGLKRLMRVLKPHTIIVYGSANYECFEKLKKRGVIIVPFPCKTRRAFAKGGNDE